MTVFKKIINRELPAKIVYEDDKCLAFEDINPVAPTHILVIPKKEIPKLSDIEESDKELLGHLLWVIKKIAKERGLEGYRVCLNVGKEGGQHIFHLHFHLIGGRPFEWPPG